MDNDTSTKPEGPAPTEPGRDARGLHRSNQHRVLGGVAGGIAERFDVDPNLVRVAFVVATALWGLGALIYLAMLAIIPRAGDDGGPLARSQLLRSLVASAAIVIGVLVVLNRGAGPHWNGLGTGWFVALVIIGSIWWLGQRRTVWRVARRAVLVLLSALALLVASVAIIVAFAGVPFAGGIGDRFVQPLTRAQVKPVYRLGVGSLTIDLSDVALGTRPLHLSASVAVGSLVVEVSRNVVVSLNAASGVGTVRYPDPVRGVAGSVHLDLHASVGIGRVLIEHQ